jgi:uncharacterized membrane protein (DUF106 family)
VKVDGTVIKTGHIIATITLLGMLTGSIYSYAQKCANDSTFQDSTEKEIEKINVKMDDYDDEQRELHLLLVKISKDMDHMKEIEKLKNPNTYKRAEKTINGDSVKIDTIP